MLCQNCSSPGHKDWFCKHPHTCCLEEYLCFVLEDHYNVARGRCPSTVQIHLRCEKGVMLQNDPDCLRLLTHFHLLIYIA